MRDLGISKFLTGRDYAIAVAAFMHFHVSDLRKAYGFGLRFPAKNRFPLGGSLVQVNRAHQVLSTDNQF